MADLIVGEPTNLTVVADNGAGFCRIYLNPWELDWEFYDAIAVGHWLANTTSGVSAQITAKGGTEWLGYWFDITTAFPSANWVTGNRITPQRQAAINQFATFAAAIAGGAADDMMLWWYNGASNLRTWGVSVDIVNMGMSVWGMLSRGQLALNTGTIGFRVRGNLLAQAVQVQWINLRVHGQNGQAFGYTPTAGQAGAGLIASRCSQIGSATGFTAINHAAGTVIWQNCLGWGGNNMFLRGVGRNCHAFQGNIGFNTMDADLRNLVAIECNTCFAGGAVAGARYCADVDGSLPVHATNLRNQNARTQLRTFFDLAGPGRKQFPWSPVIQHDSVLRSSGVAIAGVATDFFGTVRPAVPSIGAFEPYPVAYAPGAQIIRGVRRRGLSA